MIRWGLHDLPPLAFASLRFAAVALLILFVGRPAIGWQMLLLYGAGWGVVQFAGLFLALHFGLPTSLSSVLAQLQVFFTLLFSVALGWETLSRRKLLSLALAVIGVGLIVSDRPAALPATALGFSCSARPAGPA
ncbi:EamA family transporter, partial [Methylomonas koyamae]|uniref:EamA family transporter n=1 Tax=Methylomonas koyamae TaxID=702114 RepID=UPI0021103BAC